MNETHPSHSTEHKDYTPHVLPLKVYLGIGGALFFLTIVTVAVAQIHLGPFNLVVALAIAILKASLVALFFMHLLYDNKFFMIIFMSSVVFLGIFIIITMFDTMRRGDITAEVRKPIYEQAVIYEAIPDSSNAMDHATHGGGH